MNIIYRVGNKFRSLYWKLISKRKKRLFETSQVSTYQYMDELFCIDKTVYDELVKRNLKARITCSYAVKYFSENKDKTDILKK